MKSTFSTSELQTQFRQRLGEPRLELRLEPQQGRIRSEAEDRLQARQELRQRLLSTLEELGHTLTSAKKAELRNLDQIPLQIGQGLYCSISHSEQWRGFVLAPRPCGFDCESPTRVRPEVISRVSSPQELQDSPSPGALWCGKEAAFKALKARFPSLKLLSQIEIGTWQSFTKSSQPEIYQIHSVQNIVDARGTGAVLSDAEQIFSICLLTP